MARLDRTRGTLETAFQPLEAYGQSAIPTWGYPKAAWLGLCRAWVASKRWAVVLAALRGVQGQENGDAAGSLSSMANAIATPDNGRRSAIPEAEGDGLARRRAPDRGATRHDVAQRGALRT